MQPDNTAEIITELPVMELSFADAYASPDEARRIAHQLQECARSFSSGTLALLPTATDIFQVLPVSGEVLAPQSVSCLLTARKDRVYIVRTDEA